MRVTSNAGFYPPSSTQWYQSQHPTPWFPWVDILMPAPLPFQWSKPQSHEYSRWLPTAWGHIDIAPPFLFRWPQSESHLYNWASYSLGTHRYCFIHYRSKDLSRSPTYTTGLPMAWEHIDIASFIIVPKISAVVMPIHYRTKDLSRSHISD